MRWSFICLTRGNSSWRLIQYMFEQNDNWHNKPDIKVVNMWNKPIPLFASWTVFVGCICSCFRCSDCFSSVVCWSTCDPTSRVFVLPCFPPVERSSAGLPLPLLLPGRPTLSSIINESQPRITAEPQCCIYCTVGLFTQTSCDVALSVFLPLSVLSWGLFFFSFPSLP